VVVDPPVAAIPPVASLGELSVLPQDKAPTNANAGAAVARRVTCLMVLKRQYTGTRTLRSMDHQNYDVLNRFTMFWILGRRSALSCRQRLGHTRLQHPAQRCAEPPIYSL